jgi:hypothetical protein
VQRLQPRRIVELDVVHDGRDGRCPHAATPDVANRHLGTTGDVHDTNSVVPRRAGHVVHGRDRAATHRTEQNRTEQSRAGCQ